MAETIDKIINFSVGSLTIGRILSAVIIFLICHYMTKFILKFMRNAAERVNRNAIVQKFIYAATRVVLYIFTFIIVADSLGINVSSFVAAFSVVGLAVSLAIQDTLANVAGGVMLLVSKPFQVGDYVETEGKDGIIEEVGLVHTKMVTYDHKEIFIPNSRIVAGVVTNYTGQEIRRVDVVVGASYNESADKVKAALLEAVGMVPQILKEPAAVAVISGYEDSRISYTVRGWTKTEDYWDAYFGLIESCKRAFEKNNLTMEYNHLNVHMKQD